MSSTSCEPQSIVGTIFGGSGSSQGNNNDVDHVMILAENLKNSLYLNSEHADVSLVVEGEKFPAHKIILASRSEYFRALLFGGMRESSQSEIELTTATKAAFKVLLKYVYSGRLSLGELKEDVILDVLGLCHQWGFEDLEQSVCEFLQATLHVGNVCAIFDTALAFGLHSLVLTCCLFGDINAVTLMEHPSFLTLSPMGVTELISRDSFCAEEEKIFECVANWVRHNQEIHKRAASEVLHGVRLPLMNITTLLNVVRRTNLVSPDSILDAIQSKQTRETELHYRGYLMPEENVAHAKHGANALKGEMGRSVVDGDIQNYDIEKGFARHVIDENGEGGTGIVVQLRQQCILNHIRLLLWDRDLRSYSYYVEVKCTDEEDWVRICDHTKYHCRSWQNIYFPQRVIKFIKVVGTHNTVNRMFHLVQVEAFYTKREFSIHPKLGLLCPKDNVATIDMSACVIEGVSRCRNALIDGKTAGYDWDSGYTCHQLGSGAIVIQLAQPYVVSSMRLLLWDCDDRSYSYYIEVSTNQRNWEMVCNKSREKCKSWQIIRFQPIPVVYVRIVGTDNTANEVFHCVHFECPAQIDGATEEPNTQDVETLTGESGKSIVPHTASASTSATNVQNSAASEVSTASSTSPFQSSVPLAMLGAASSLLLMEIGENSMEQHGVDAEDAEDARSFKEALNENDLAE